MKTLIKPLKVLCIVLLLVSMFIGAALIGNANFEAGYEQGYMTGHIRGNTDGARQQMKRQEVMEKAWQVLEQSLEGGPIPLVPEVPAVKFELPESEVQEFDFTKPRPKHTI